jgi:uncharacterized membrane protein
MISIIEAIDSFLLEKVFQKFSDFFQMATGMTCFFLAKIAIILSFASWVIFVISDPDDNPYLLIISLFTLYLAYNAWKLTAIADVAEWQMNEGRRMKNPAALALFPLRFLSLLIFPLSLIGALSLRGHDGWISDLRLLYLTAFVMFEVIWIYFFSCTPLPPGESKVKQWLEGPTTVAAPAE